MSPMEMAREHDERGDLAAAERLCAEVVSVGARPCGRLASAGRGRRPIRPHANPPDPERRLRIGYVSPVFRNHGDAPAKLLTLYRKAAHPRAVDWGLSWH